MDSLLAQLDSWKPFGAVVVGDFMLDQLLYGNAERLAADAPVPILHVLDRHDRPGGAANVCLDLAALKGRVRAFGVVGDDAYGRVLRESLEARGIGGVGLVVDAARPTTVKQNLIGLAQARHPQKMFRVDFESRAPLPEGVVRELLSRLEGALDGADVVCVEDYDKGVCTPAVCREIIARARRHRKPVFVDPARLADYSKYAGATAITPNRTEAELATGLETHGDGEVDHNAEVAKGLFERLDLEAAVLTLDRHGALLFTREGPTAVPTIARKVYDVTGAGDMFLAGLAAARANGLGWVDSVRFANAGAGLEVEIFGVEPIPLERVHQSLLDMATVRHGKLRTLPQVLVEVAARRAKGERVVFTNGCFDVIHSGHVSLLAKARACGDFLVVGLNDDASVRHLKGEGRPVNPEEDRARVLSAMDAVGAVVLFAEPTPVELIRAVKPDVLVKGADYTRNKVVGADIVERYGGRVELVELVQGKSTTSTIARMHGAQRPVN